MDKEEQVYNGSKIFVSFAKSGDVKKLVDFVFNGESPFIDIIPSKEKLARNALQFLCINQDLNKIHEYFNTPFVDFLNESGKRDAINSSIYSKNIKLFNCLWKEYNFKDALNNQLKDIIKMSVQYGFNDVLSVLINPIKDILTQEEKMSICLSSIEKNINTKNISSLTSFKTLELLFDDLKYHQQNDILVRTCVSNKEYEMINYLMIDKCLRITKHIYLIQDSDFSKIVSRRRLFDSMNDKEKNRTNISLKEKNNKKHKI